MFGTSMTITTQVIIVLCVINMTFVVFYCYILDYVSIAVDGNERIGIIFRVLTRIDKNRRKENLFHLKR